MSPREMSELNERAALEAYRAAACAEADAHFDDRALDAQRHKILARLAHLGHPAKVIRFPNTQQVEVAASGVNRRWITVAAAAGLLIGLLGGQLVHLLPQPTRRLSPMAGSIAPSAPVHPSIVAASFPADDGLLERIELAIQLRSASELRVLDEITPLEEQ
jgi:hypothetical protein